MAIVYGSWGNSFYPSGADASRKMRAMVDYTVTETDTAVTITLKAGLETNRSWSSSNFTIYLKEGGSGDDGTNLKSKSTSFSYVNSNPQQRWTDAVTITINKGADTQTKVYRSYINYTATTGKGVYKASYTLTVQAGLVTITFMPNGGDSVPPPQQVVRGVQSQITSQLPTRNGHTFHGWSTSPSTAWNNTEYPTQVQQCYVTLSSDYTLYAIWHESYRQPIIEGARAYRVDGNVNVFQPSITPSGTRIYFDFSLTGLQHGTVASVIAKFKNPTTISSEVSLSLDGTSQRYYGYSPSNFSIDTTKSGSVSAEIKVTAYTGTVYTYNIETFITSEQYLWDAFRDTQGGVTYQGFALGGASRDFDTQANQRDANGDFDCYMKAHFHNGISDIADLVYPIGSIYMSVNATNPSTLFGGTWVAWGSGRVPVGVDTSQSEFNSVEKLGGEKTHTLSLDEIPSHRHKMLRNYSNGSGSSSAYVYQSNRVLQTIYTDYQGGGQAHNNLQPYITCYMWKRTA